MIARPPTEGGVMAAKPIPKGYHTLAPSLIVDPASELDPV